MKAALILLLLTGCYTGPAAFHAIGEGYERDVYDCSDQAWAWIDHLISTGTDPEDLRYIELENTTTIFDEPLATGTYHACVARRDGGVWYYDDPSAGYYGMEPWLYMDKFGSRRVMEAR